MQVGKSTSRQGGSCIQAVVYPNEGIEEYHKGGRLSKAKTD